MLDLASPLAGLEAPPTPLQPDVTLREVAGLSATMLHGALEGLPPPGRSAALPMGTALWVAPGQWLLFHPRDAVALFPDSQRTPLHGARCVLAVEGPRAAETLATLLPLDLHPRAFGPDAAAATVAAHVSVLVWRQGEGFRLSCYRSFARALAEAVISAGRGRGLAVLPAAS